jgi:WS/DGAT/MGAT family acyltransferase
MAERMTDVEALMWHVEKDPHLAATVANLTICDRPPDVERLRRRLTGAIVEIPRLGQRVVPAFGRLAPPEWRDDPSIDLDYHVRQLAAPEPGGEAELTALVTTLSQVPLDRTRPLWEFTVVSGLEGGRAALFQRLHHTVTDGEGGMRLSMQFLDLERHPGPGDDSPAVSGPMAPAADTASLWATAASTLAHDVRRQVGIGRRVVGDAAGLVRHPSRLASTASTAVETTRSLARQGLVTDKARSPLWRERSLRRSFALLRVPLDEVKQAAAALGGTVNDLFVAGAAGGAGAYHRARDMPVDELRTAMPVSTREKGAALASNAFTPVRVLVPTSADPVERFDAVRERLSAAKAERAIGAVSALAGLVNLLPTSAVVRLARQQAETVDFATSNLRGAPLELYIAGAKVEANYPMGPLAGTAFNLTTISYNGSLDMGLTVDTAAVDDPALLRRCLESSFAELLRAGGAGRTTKPAPAARASGTTAGVRRR